MIDRLFIAGLVAVATVTVAPNAFAQKDDVRKPPVSAQKENKPQATVASKTATFATIAATDAKVKAALKPEDLPAAQKLIGKEATFSGTVAKVFQPKSNSVVLLNFAENYRDAISAAIQAKDFPAFPDLNTLAGKKVLITGKVMDYHGRTEVELTSVAQVKLVK